MRSVVRRAFRHHVITSESGSLISWVGDRLAPGGPLRQNTTTSCCAHAHIALRSSRVFLTQAVQ